METLHGQKTVFFPHSCKGGEKWPTQCWPRVFYRKAQRQPCYLGPGLKPTHLLCPALSADTESKSQGHCRKWHHKLKVAWSICASIAYNGLTVAIILCKTTGLEWCWLLVNVVNPTNQINSKNDFHIRSFHIKPILGMLQSWAFGFVNHLGLSI